jgi:hypothetical protein
MPLRGWETRLRRLEARYGPPEDPTAKALNEAIERASYDDVDLLFGACVRLGVEGGVGAADLHALLDEEEAAALVRLCELCDEVLEEGGLGG